MTILKIERKRSVLLNDATNCKDYVLIVSVADE
jgi:hypothetical protein